MQLALRVAGLIGCTLAELPQRIGWDEWLIWEAWYDLEPWGEWRADLRQSVAIAYQLAPYLPAGRELPAVVWPYYETEEELDLAKLQEQLEADQQRWAEWDATRPRTTGG